MSPSQPTPALGARCWFPAQKQFSLEQAVVGSEQLPGLWCAVCCVPEPGCPYGAAVLGETCSPGSWCHTPGGYFETLWGWKLCCLILVLLTSLIPDYWQVGDVSFLKSCCQGTAVRFHQQRCCAGGSFPSEVGWLGGKLLAHGGTFLSLQGSSLG